MSAVCAHCAAPQRKKALTHNALGAGASRPQSQALTSASSSARPKPSQTQKAGAASTGKTVKGRGQFSATSSAHGQDATAQVLHLDQWLHHPASSATAQNERRASQARRR